MNNEQSPLNYWADQNMRRTIGIFLSFPYEERKIDAQSREHDSCREHFLYEKDLVENKFKIIHCGSTEWMAKKDKS